ncbi:MAG TPA: RAD55 family ATPase [Methanobacteriaceae archaeon]|nr:RAD55 family ATPase [Methanobacteriaceae archaeon]
MNPNRTIEWGIPGLDEVIGGLPENTVTLVYGPPKVGKSIFCYQFALHGLDMEEQCLYLAVDYGLHQLKQNLLNFDWSMDKYLENKQMYIIDVISSLSGAKFPHSSTHILSSVHDPTDMMIKLGMGTKSLFHNSSGFRSVLDSLTTLLAFNRDKIVLRLINAYIRRMKEASGTSILTYTEGVSDPKIENILKSSVDNLIFLDGKTLYLEAVIGEDQFEVPYEINEKGIIVKKN